MNFPTPDDYNTREDQKRLSRQHIAIRELMLDGVWRTVEDISKLTQEPNLCSISAQLRHLRKPEYGGYVVSRRKRFGTNQSEYRMIPRVSFHRQTDLGLEIPLVAFYDN